MTIKISNYQIGLYEGKSSKVDAPTKEHEATVYESLDQLCTLMKDAPFEWFLVGGLGIDLRIGELTRCHSDIDIEVSCCDIEEMLLYMAGRGYSFYRKVFITNVPRGKKLFVYESSDGSNCGPDIKDRYRFIKSEDGLIIDGTLDLLSYIDVFFSRYHQNGVEVGYKGKSIILSVPYSSEDMIVVHNGHKIRTRNPLYAAFLKINSNSATAEFDMNTIMRFVEEDQLALLK